MTETTNTPKKSRGMYWVITLVSAIAMTLIILYRPEAFWLPLPILVTAFALANDWI